MMVREVAGVLGATLLGLVVAGALEMLVDDVRHRPATAPKPPAWDASSPARHVDDPYLGESVETRR